MCKTPFAFVCPVGLGGNLLTIFAEARTLRRVNRFLYSPGYFFALCGLTLLSNLLGAELFVYTVFILTAVYVCCFGRDLLPLMPIAILCYIAPSMANNPGRNEQSIFALGSGGGYLLFLAALLAAALICRLVKDPEFGGRKFFAMKRSLTPGFLALGAAYMLAGLGSSQFLANGWRNALFGLIQFAAMFGLYYLFSGSVRWDKAPKGYLAWTGMTVGYTLLGELIFIYLTNGVIFDGVILRGNIYTGWGHYNNIGALLAMVIPFTFFLSGKGRHSWIFHFSGLLFLTGLIFTCSRGSIICGVFMYICAYTISFIRSTRKRSSLGAHIMVLVVGLLLLLIFHQRLLRMFHILLEWGMNPSDRDVHYIAGLKQFWKDPLFGGSFFPGDHDLYSWSTSEKFVAIFPPRWHNTFIQILASCGVVGMAAYVWHRVQTVKVFFKHPTMSKSFVALSVFALLSTSMVDCHLFNVGPALFYSMSLAFTEFRLDHDPVWKLPNGRTIFSRQEQSKR